MNDFVADRADIWRCAYNTMKDVGIKEPEPADVMELAEFLSGDNLPDAPPPEAEEDGE